MMRLNEIAGKQKRGTYIGVEYDSESIDKLVDLMDKLKVPNPTNKNKIHSTIIYSRKYVPDIELKNGSLYPIKAQGAELHIFHTQDKKNALVLKLDCDDLKTRHTDIMEEYKTTYDFPEYIPHVTLSYDCGDFDPSSHKGKLPNLVIAKEYIEDLVLDWGKS